MKNPFKKKKKEEKGEETSKKASKEKINSTPPPRRSFINEPPIPKEDIPMSDNEYKLNHLVETELNVIQKKAKSLHLKAEDNFAEKSDDNYWKVSVNEFMKYINQRSQIIIDQLSKKSHAVDIDMEDTSD
jgi:hypothetical protein